MAIEIKHKCRITGCDTHTVRITGNAQRSAAYSVFIATVSDPMVDVETITVTENGNDVTGELSALVVEEAVASNPQGVVAELIRQVLMGE